MSSRCICIAAGAASRRRRAMYSCDGTGTEGRGFESFVDISFVDIVTRAISAKIALLKYSGLGSI